MFSSKDDANDKDEMVHGFVMVDYQYSHTAYFPTQVNRIFSGWLANTPSIKIENMFYDIEKPDEAIGRLLSHKKAKEKIALFNVADFPSGGYLLQRNSVASVLESYKNKGVVCNKIIIPVAELGRNHFRLLVIKPLKKTAVFYDSKAFMIGYPLEVVSSSLSAYYEEGSSTYQMLANFKKNYNYIQDACTKVFPQIQYSEYYLGHQEMKNHIDCGPYTVEYAIHEMLGETQLLDLQIDITEVRGKHEEWYKKFQNITESTLRESKNLFDDDDDTIAEELIEYELFQPGLRK